jgi:hypothetical protein
MADQREADDTKEVTYVVYARVERLEERFRQVYVSGMGDATVFKNESLGWYAHFAGSWESVYFGAAKPAFEAGDTMRITFTRGRGPNTSTA